MSLFRKNPNEVAYTEGKKHWTDVIKNTGDGNLLIWRQPEEDFNTNSTLIVMPGEEAIFVNGGNIEQVFGPGTYKLSTENYPFISRLRNAFSGGISTFNCVVYFVRHADSKEILWGTASPIQVRDKVWGVMTEARSHGSYKVRIDNAAMFLEKLLSNNVPFLRQEDLNEYFANQFQSTIVSTLSKFLNETERELIGISEYVLELSEKIKPNINEALLEYGLRCVNFSISRLDIDKTKYDELDKSQIDYISKRREFESAKAGFDILGENWDKQQQVEIMKTMAGNQGAGGIAAAGAGIGMGFAAGNAFGNITQQTFTQTPLTNAGNQSHVEDPVETLAKLKKMLDAGLIEQAEYDAKKAEILSRM